MGPIRFTKNDLPLPEQFAKLYRAATNGRLRPELRYVAFRQAMTVFRTWCLKLILPHLTPEQRAAMAGKDLPGLHTLLSAIEQKLATLPAAAAALKMTSAVIHELRRKDVELHTALDRANTLVAAAAQGTRDITSRIKDLGDKVMASATRMAADGSLDAATRGQAQDVLDAIDEFNNRRTGAQTKRQQRVQLRLASLRKQAQAALLAKHKGVAVAPATLPDVTPDPATPAGQGAGQAPGKAKGKTGRGQGPADPDDLPVPDLDKALGAPLEQFEQCNNDLESLVQQTSAADGEPGTAQAAPALDQLYYEEYGAFLAVTLEDAPAVQKDAGVAPADLDALVPIALDCEGAQRDGGIFQGRTKDGHLVIAAFAMLCYDQLDAWLTARINDPSLTLDQQQAYKTEQRTLRAAHEQAKTRIDAHTAQTKGKAAALQGTIGQAHADANLQRVRDALAAGQAVDAESYFAAATTQAQRHDDELQKAVAAMGQAGEKVAAKTGARKTKR